jgi:hypothetical protein
MTLFAFVSLSIWDALSYRLHQFLQQGAAVLEQRVAQPQLDGFQIIEALLSPLLANQGYEGVRFLELFVLELGRF